MMANSRLNDWLAGAIDMDVNMANPNRCETCDYIKIKGDKDGHCYMFRDEPTDVCHQHSGRNFFRSLEEELLFLGDVRRIIFWDA